MKTALSKLGKNYTTDSNNTTVLLNGRCNADCQFCFWDRNNSKIIAPDDYLDKIFNNLKTINGLSNVLSISGGEPTLSKYFSKFLIKLSKFRRDFKLNRVVLLHMVAIYYHI